jgi:hypothetical protein
MAGYSGTPLAQKLGIKGASRVLLLGAPEGFEGTLGELPAGVAVSRRVGKGQYDVVVLFVEDAAALTARFDAARERLEQNGGLWVAWPKKASGVKTDLTEDRVRDVGLAAGLVDNKVCAIDDVWSGLRLVVRVRDRVK